MPVPRRRHCRSRQGKRRAHVKLHARQVTTCQNCQGPTLPHRVCPTCGTYKGVQYAEPKDNPYLY